MIPFLMSINYSGAWKFGQRGEGEHKDGVPAKMLVDRMVLLAEVFYID